MYPWGNISLIPYYPKLVSTVKGHLYPQAISRNHIFCHLLIQLPKIIGKIVTDLNRRRLYVGHEALGFPSSEGDNTYFSVRPIVFSKYCIICVHSSISNQHYGLAANTSLSCVIEL